MKQEIYFIRKGLYRFTRWQKEEEDLEQLSYKSELGIKLKKNLHYFDKQKLFDELAKVSEWYDASPYLHDITIDYRIKSIQSAHLKYERYYPDHQAVMHFEHQSAMLRGKT